MVGSNGNSGYLLDLYSYHPEKKRFFIIAMLAEAPWREGWLITTEWWGKSWLSIGPTPLIPPYLWRGRGKPSYYRMDMDFQSSYVVSTETTLRMTMGKLLIIWWGYMSQLPSWTFWHHPSRVIWLSCEVWQRWMSRPPIRPLLLEMGCYSNVFCSVSLEYSGYCLNVFCLASLFILVFWLE